MFIEEKPSLYMEVDTTIQGICVLNGLKFVKTVVYFNIFN